MARPIPSLHLVGDANSSRGRAVLAAGGAAKLAPAFRQSADFSSAHSAAEARSEVIVLLEPRAADVRDALGTLDARGLPRWAVVPSSAEEAHSPEFARADWESPMLARSILSALTLLDLRRENTRLRGDLATMGRRLTHDFRTPLSSISTANEALAEPAVATELAPDLHRAIADAVQEAGDLLARVGAVFMASARPIELQPVDMEEVVWNVRQRYDAQVHLAGATIVCPDNWPVVDGEASLLEVVWGNLLLNSLQHAGPAPRIEMGWKRLETETCFWLRDHGPGVRAGQRSRLFHPIDRLNELDAPRGYGLSLVQRLIELHFGTVGYDPEPVPGGTFFFTLP
ncbi:MAG TPA: ATP-binding protein [Opitutaceae bacterium]|nr:ATP-binding protein [Opitutaceae bacterium]